MKCVKRKENSTMNPVKTCDCAEGKNFCQKTAKAIFLLLIKKGIVDRISTLHDLSRDIDLNLQIGIRFSEEDNSPTAPLNESN